MAFPKCRLSGVRDVEDSNKKYGTDKAYNVLKLCIIIMAIIILTLSAQAAAATLDVDGADPSCSDATGSPYCKIQAAIDAAATADTVLVMPGTYQENINFKGKAITVRSVQGPLLTIIDGGRVDTVAYFGNGETSASVLDGFTLQNGYAGTGSLAIYSGGGIVIENASPTIKNNVITDNMADLPGFGIDIYYGSPIIDGNTISNNRGSGCCTGGDGGGGIRIVGTGSAQIINNTITNNSITPGFDGGGGIDLFGAATLLIRNNFISGNSGRYGGGIGILGGSQSLIVQNVIVDNTATSAGGGIYWRVPSSGPGPIVADNTIANNTSPQGSGVFADGHDASTELTNNLIIAAPGQDAVFCGDFSDLNPPIFNSNDIYSATGTAYAGICTSQTGLNGNISVDPSFVGTAPDNYRLDIGSQVIDKGDSTNPNLPATDFAGTSRIFGGGVDMGAYEFTPNAGYLEFSISTYSVHESDPSATITVRRGGGSSGVVTVDFSTSDGTARAGFDYSAASGTLIFSDGDMADKSFTVLILDDTLHENSESVNLQLANPNGGATLGPESTATLSISDNDAAYSPAPLPTDTVTSGGGGCFISTTADMGPIVEQLKY